jgi:hypothetical protein
LAEPRKARIFPGTAIAITNLNRALFRPERMKIIPNIPTLAQNTFCPIVITLPLPSRASTWTKIFVKKSAHVARHTFHRPANIRIPVNLGFLDFSTNNCLSSFQIMFINQLGIEYNGSRASALCRKQTLLPL